MRLTGHPTDEALLRELGGRLAQLRLERNLTQAQLAEQAGLSKRTVERLESGGAATRLSGFLRICRVLDLMERLDLLIAAPRPGPIQQLELRNKKRRRASAGKKKTSPSKTWRWGDER